MQIVTSKGQIQYSLISDIAFSSSDDFSNIAFDLLRTFPKDILQLNDSWSFFGFNRNLMLNQGLSIFTFPPSFFGNDIEDVKAKFQYYSNIWNIGAIKVFLIDSRIKNHKSLGELIKSMPHSYVRLIGNEIQAGMLYYPQKILFGNALELINLIRQNSSEIFEEIRNAYQIDIEELHLNPNNARPDLNPYYPSNINEPDFYILNSILSNYWMEETKTDKDNTNAPNEKRVDWLLNQVRTIDGLHLFVKPIIENEKKTIKAHPELPSLILVAPYHFPKFEKLIKLDKPLDKISKSVIQIVRSEQEKDYSYIVDADKAEKFTKKALAEMINVTHQKLTFLDHVACLHAHLTYSPILRLPLVGKSINNDLSHFEKTFSTKRKEVEKIEKIGNLMKQKLIDERIGEYISERNGQIVAISDLPLEWMILDKYPICFTHDICRIPELNQPSLINNCIKNQRINYLIKQDLIKKTLILHCASDDDKPMQAMFKVIDSFKSNLGFESERCSSIADIKAAINKYKPDLLIFDCHGNSDKETLSSYLILDGKKGHYLTGDDIIKHGISAPLIFISACSTMPTYGYVKFLSDAFFQAGAYSVTATFLPIEMRAATSVNVRLLSKLKQLESGVFHSNWLEFIAHVLRTVLIHETVNRAKEKIGSKAEIENGKIAEMLSKTIYFDLRTAAFDDLIDYLKSLDPTFQLSYSDLNHEWLSYTTLGRADLLYFENWLKEYQLTNYGEIPPSVERAVQPWEYRGKNEFGNSEIWD